jgi:hypothetical protein
VPLGWCGVPNRAVAVLVVVPSDECLTNCGLFQRSKGIAWIRMDDISVSEKRFEYGLSSLTLGPTE